MARPTLLEDPALHRALVQERKDKFKSFKAKMNSRRTLSDKVADILTEAFGTVAFLVLNAIFFSGWISVNIGLIPGVAIFDPFPFGLLTTIVSLEAIFLAIIVLVSQNRSARIAELREELALHVNVQAEEEITKILLLIDRLDNNFGLPEEDDAELIAMEKKTDLDEIESELEQEIK